MKPGRWRIFVRRHRCAWYFVVMAITMGILAWNIATDRGYLWVSIWAFLLAGDLRNWLNAADEVIDGDTSDWERRKLGDDWRPVR